MAVKQDRSWPKDLPALLIQQIRLQWYKDCRGGNAAAQRNQYPRAMRLPRACLKNKSCTKGANMRN